MSPQSLFIGCALFFLCHSLATGEDFAQPPQWSDEVKNVFFDDARKVLSGTPPTTASEAKAIDERIKTSRSNVNWQGLIEAETLTTEVKRLVNNLSSLTKNPAQFKAAKYNDCRIDLTVLATLFGVISEYPGDIRWKHDAAEVEHRCLQAADSCSDGTARSLAVVKVTHDTLQELLRGQALAADEADNTTRSPAFAPLMQRMEQAVRDNLPAMLTKDRDFRKRSVDVAHEAQLLALLSQVIRAEEYGYADDESYRSHANELRDSASQLREAASTQNFARATQAAAAVTQSCAKCHADYRG